MKIPIYQVDAFADRLFSGNPAAVVFPKAALPLETMQAIAAENNLSRRGGDLVCRHLGERVEIGGRAKTYLIGEISL